MIFAKVRITDHQVVELNTISMGFDPLDFLEIETAHEFNATDDYVFNAGSQTFYNIGPKQEVVKPAKTAVVTSPFSSADNFRFRGKGYTGVALKSPDGSPTDTTIDWLIPEERFINGTHVILKNHVFGDHYKVNMVDTTFAYAGVLYPAQYDAGGGTMLEWSAVMPTGIVLDDFLDSWYVMEDLQGQKPIKIGYPGRVLAGLSIRLIYTAHGTAEDVDVILNGFLHMKTEEVT